MPVSGNPFGVLKRALEKTARDKLDVRREVAKTVKKLIKGQFALGVDPDGRTQPARADGKEAFVSKRLGNAIAVTPTQDGVEGVGELKQSMSVRGRRQWLNAHQKGHEFPARQSSGNRIAFNAAGRRVSIASLKKAVSGSERVSVRKSWLGLRTTKTVRRTAESKRVTVGQREAFWREQKNSARLRGRITNARAHTVGKRVLVPRLIYPEGATGARWGGWIKATVSQTLSKQLEKNVKGG